MATPFRERKKFKNIFGSQMAYIEDGEGDPIVFLHGNPTSSYLWRNIMPYLSGKGRLIAPDLIGMGDSDKLENSGPDRYTFAEQSKYLFALLEQLSVNENVTLVLHDWGSALGFDWARKHESALKGIGFMEALVRPIADWEDFPEAARELFQAIRSPAGEEIMLEKNTFIEGLLPGSIIRDLSDEEMSEYRRPFLHAGEDRRPPLTFARQVPIGGEPADVVDTIAAYSHWLTQTNVPKLFVQAEPGAMITGSRSEFVRTFPNLTEVTVTGRHYLQEDSPEETGEALREWHATLNQKN